MSKKIDNNAMSHLLDGLTSSGPGESNVVKHSSVPTLMKEETAVTRKRLSSKRQKETVCTSIEKSVMHKIRAISEKEGVQINELITLGLGMVISKYEERHGQIRPKKEPHGDINSIFR